MIKLQRIIFLRKTDQVLDDRVRSRFGTMFDVFSLDTETSQIDPMDQSVFGEAVSSIMGNYDIFSAIEYIQDAQPIALNPNLYPIVRNGMVEAIGTHMT